MRTAGEEFAMALRLMGVAPVWDTTSDRVTGFDVITLAMLGRPRIDVSLRISGLFRDVFAGLPAMFEQAAAALAARDEPETENPYRSAPGPRVFGPAPGDYGIGVVDGDRRLHGGHRGGCRRSLACRQRLCLWRRR